MLRRIVFPNGDRRPLAIVLFALLGGCGAAGEVGEVYPGAAGEIRQTLLRIDELPPIFGSNAVDTHVINNGDGTITWTASQRFKPVLRFIARTEPVDAAHTRVTVQITGPTSAEDDEVARRLAENPTVRDLYLAAMVEQVDATLEGRDFDMTAISGQLALATAANMGETVDRLDRAAAEYQRRDAENVAKAYEQEANGGWD